MPKRPSREEMLKVVLKHKPKIGEDYINNISDELLYSDYLDCLEDSEEEIK